MRAAQPAAHPHAGDHGLKPHTTHMGHVIFIGAGPGAADLITVRGAQRLAGADVVLFDALTDPALRIYAPKARWIDVGKRGFAHATAQAHIDTLLVQLAQEHAVVVRLKGGDPSVFGRLEEELQALQAAGIACEVVPGVTAALAAAAASQRPLTRRGRGRRLTLATAMTHEGAAPAGRPANVDTAGNTDTEVLYMAGRQLPRLGRQLAGAGWPAGTPVLVVSRAGWPDELASEHCLADLGQAALLHGGRPTVVTVGAGAAAITPQQADLSRRKKSGKTASASQAGA